MQISSPSSTLTERFAAILAALVVAVRANEGRSRVFWQKWPLVWNRVMAIRDAVLAVIAAIEAGTVRPVRVRAVGVRRQGSGGRALSEGFLALRGVPTRFGWLVREGGWRVAAFLGQLEHLLADPEMRRLLAASPRLAQALRPVCRMLGIRASIYELSAEEVVAIAAEPVATAVVTEVAPPAQESVPEDPAQKFIPFWIRSLPG